MEKKNILIVLVLFSFLSTGLLAGRRPGRRSGRRGRRSSLFNRGRRHHGRSRRHRGPGLSFFWGALPTYSRTDLDYSRDLTNLQNAVKVDLINLNSKFTNMEIKMNDLINKITDLTSRIKLLENK